MIEIPVWLFALMCALSALMILSVAMFMLFLKIDKDNAPMTEEEEMRAQRQSAYERLHK